MKICNQCNKSLSTSEFYKKTKSKDGLQSNCKQCCKVINTKFRETNPNYQNEWYDKNETKWLEYVTEWANKNIRADDSRSALYVVVNPEQKIYVGMTQTKFSVRKGDHKAQYLTKQHKHIPLLHKSFDMYGWDNHKWYVFEMEGTCREVLKRMESNLIQKVQKQGMSLNIKK